MGFIEEILPYVLEDAKTSGVLPSITLAQAILESNWGKSKLATEGKNLFGIKGMGGIYETQEFVDGRMITIKDGFRHYDDWGGSIRDHSDFLLVNKRYEKSGFFDCCRALDYGGAAKALQIAGYATDPIYQVKLRGIINQYKLYEYDKLEDVDDVPKLEKWEADTIIDTWISPSWKRAEADRREASASGQDDAAKAYEDIKSNCHELANALRRASGQAET